MSTELYLDTARLGRMCRGARMAEHDFVRLVSQLRSPLYFGRFLAKGFRALCSRDRDRFLALRCWPGVAGLKRKLGRFVSQPPCPTFQFAASHSLIRFAAECLFDSARSVLTTDLAWPPYLRVLEDVAVRRNATLHIVRVRRAIFERAATAEQLVETAAQAYQANNCDGLFLSDISYLGVRIPVRTIVNGVTACRRPFVVVDGAQALGQRPVRIQELNCDLYLAGTQKWVSAYHPLRLAFVGRPDSLALIHAARGRLSRSREFYDPLLDFADEVERNEFRTFGETVNLVSLITAAGALQNLRDNERLERRWEKRLENAQALLDYLSPSHQWSGAIQSELRSGILLISPPTQIATRPVLASIYRALKKHGIAATVLPDGDLRLAMPSYTLSLQHLSRIIAAVQGSRNAWIYPPEG